MVAAISWVDSSYYTAETLGFINVNGYEVPIMVTYDDDFSLWSASHFSHYHHKRAEGFKTKQAAIDWLKEDAAKLTNLPRHLWHTI